MAGKIIHQYEIIELLGEGGMGAVYKARDTKLNRLVAIKSVRGASADRKARFLQEAQAASALNHPNIVTVHDLVSDSGDDYIVMELVTGRTLDRVIPKNGLRLDDALKIAIPVASALTAAHEAGIIHRDVKPSNIMVRDDGVVKVLDFGLAKLDASAPESEDEATRTMRPQTEDGTVLGTVSYMSPEQAEGRRVDARSDVFCFGSVLYETVTGQRAFHGTSKISTLSAVLKDEPKPLHEIDATAPRELERIVSRCLKKDPERRYQLMKEVRLALEELKEESDSGRLSGSNPAVVAPPVVKSARMSWPWVAAGAAALLGLAAWGWTRLGEMPAKEPELQLRQLTQDSGYTGSPALSPDGKMVAYSSDRARGGGRDIYVQQTAPGSQAIRLTRHPGGDSHPDFSPDGASIAFESTRDGGGIYVVPTLGGEERLLISGNYHQPKFSPDGKWIALSGGQFSTRLFVIPAQGGEPRRLAPDLYRAVMMAWSPDGSHVLAHGNRGQDDKQRDWWLVDVRTGQASALGARRVFPNGVPSVSSWHDGHLFYARQNLYRIPLAMPGMKLGEPARLTRGTSSEAGPSAIRLASNGQWRIAFTSHTRGEYVLHRVPLKPNAKAEPVVVDGVSRRVPSLSTDGKRLVFIKEEIQGHAIIARDLETGAERTLLRQKEDMRARISPDGQTVAFNRSAANEKDGNVYLMPYAGGASRQICGECGLVYDWTRDGKRLMYRHGNPAAFWSLDAATGERRQVLSHPTAHFHAGRTTRDGRWITFHLAPNTGPAHIFIAPLRDGRGAPESEWIPVFTEPGYNSRPTFSADEGTLYFTSDADGFPALWSQKLDPATKRPVGSPVVIYRSDGQSGPFTGHRFGPGEAKDFFVIPLLRSTANVWIAE